MWKLKKVLETSDSFWMKWFFEKVSDIKICWRRRRLSKISKIGLEDRIYLYFEVMENKTDAEWSLPIIRFMNRKDFANTIWSIGGTSSYHSKIPFSGWKTSSFKLKFILLMNYFSGQIHLPPNRIIMDDSLNFIIKNKKKCIFH